MRVITLPNGRAVPLRAYVAAWRTVKQADPETEFRGFEWYPVPARDILRRFRAGLDQRITDGISYSQRGLPRKDV